MDPRILVVGAVGAGKSTAIRTVSAANPVMTIAPLMPQHDTFELESGVMDAGAGVAIPIYAAPDLDWSDGALDELITRSSGVLLLIDHSMPNPAADLRRFQNAFRRRRDRRPIVVAVTHTDVAPHRPMSVYGEAASRHQGYPLPIIAMDCRKPLDVRAALLTLLALLEMHRRFRPEGRASEHALDAAAPHAAQGL